MDEVGRILESKNVDDDTKLRKELKKKDYTKESLVNYIVSLRSRMEELESYSIITKQVEMLERSHMSHVQYNRCESIEIDGISTSVCDEDLENTTLSFLAEIGVPDIQPWQVHACHRLKNKKHTIIRFSTMEWADKALHNRKKLKGLDVTKLKIPEKNALFINESICPALQYLHYLVRRAQKHRKIDSYNFWKGKLSIKMHKDGPSKAIGHITLI